MNVNRYLWMPGILAALTVAFAIACGEDKTETPTTTPTVAPTGTPVETPTQAPDIRTQFPAEVQPLLQDLPDNVVELLWKVRQAGPGTIVWADAGGEFHEGTRRASLAEWEQITGWTVQSAPQPTGGTPADFEAKVGAGQTEWDVVSMSDSAAASRSVEKGLLMKLDLSYFAVDKLPETSPYTDYYIDFEDGDTPLLYNTEIFSDPDKAPQKVSDLFDTVNFPGKRCLWAWHNAGNLEYALLADGVTPDQVYPLLETAEGRQRALRKLDTIKDDIVYLNSGAESVQFILDGQCDLGLTWNGRPALRLRDEPDLPLRLVHDGAMIWNEPFGIPTGTEKYDAALSALAYHVQPRNQCDMLDIMAYGIVMEGVEECLTDFAREYGPQPALSPLSYSVGIPTYIEYDEQLLEEWEAWKTGG